MRNTIFLGCLLAFLFVRAFAGEKETPHFTGNPRVDFFGAGLLTPALMESGHAPLLLQEQEIARAAEGKKSPWIAGALSLAVPGAGEVYSENYLKGAIFFAVEAVSWYVAYDYHKKGYHQTDLFKAFANEHYSVVRYTNWTLDNLADLHPSPALPHSQDEYHQLIYGTPDPVDVGANGPPFSVVRWPELNQMELDIANGVLNGYTHQLPYYGEQQYFELIGKYDQFSRGWDDANLDPSAPLNADDPGSQVIKSNSARFYQYAEMRAQANNYYDVAGTFVAVAVVNHILSALDAFWSATRYNKDVELSLHMKLQPAGGGIGAVPLTEATVQVNF
jgi:hypothetical protein